MNDKVLGIIAIGLSAASQAFIKHHDTAMFYSVVFFAIGAYEFILGELTQRRSK